ncbi:hypothetical protein Shyd_56930 [Streptomyces hydrogenans]|uniref:HTH tetR-type domain-containing protein n=1 Tax=Streptomyces hydrogenans TaxID=1873719 RepID=A0ABQ3PH17_9ACTN|nr:hypothetical protein Shyd_56930 [Streptomyces hydrogenans]
MDKAKKGSKDLSEGLTDAKTGSSDLASGLKKLDKGSKDVQTGTRKVANGTQALADKVNGTADKVRPYLANNGTSIRDTAKLVSDSATLARNDLEDLVRRAPLLRTAAHKADDTLARLHRESCAKPGADAPVELPEGVTLPEGVALPDPKEMCAALKEASTTAGDVATVADDVHELTKDSKGDLKTLDTRLKKLKKEADELAARAPHLDEDVEGAIRKINELNKGAKKVADGAEQLHTGITGARAGSVSLDSGVGKLKKGAGDLDGGLFKLADGSGSLATGLKDGVDQIPDYDKGERDRRTEVMADPVKLAAQSLHKAPKLRHGLRPVLHPALPLGRRDGRLHDHPADEPAGPRRGRLRLADRAGRLVPGGGDRRPPGRRAPLRPALGPRPGDGQGGRHGRLPRPGDLLLRRDHPVAQRPLRRGRPDPGARAAHGPADLGGRHLPGADQSGLLQRRPPLPADDPRGRRAAPADQRRRARAGLGGGRRPRRLHAGRARPDRGLRAAQAGVDAGPAAPGTVPVTRTASVRIDPMDSSSTRRQATRAKLYEAAVTLIAEQGFSATTVDEIAERAGVAKGTVYYNFKSKTELFEELLRHGVSLLAASLRTAAEETAERGGSRIAALDAMIRAGLVFIDRYPAFTQLYVAELWRTNRAWNSTLLVVRQQAVARGRGRAARGRRGGRAERGDRRPADGGGAGRDGPGRRPGLEGVPERTLSRRRARGAVAAAARTGGRTRLIRTPDPDPGRKPQAASRKPQAANRNEKRRSDEARSPRATPDRRFLRTPPCTSTRAGRRAGPVPPPRVGGPEPRPFRGLHSLLPMAPAPIRAGTHLGPEYAYSVVTDGRRLVTITSVSVLPLVFTAAGRAGSTPTRWSCSSVSSARPGSPTRCPRRSSARTC